MVVEKAQSIFDVVIVGSGISGLFVALKLPSDLSILVVTKSDLKTSSSAKAQGGIAATIDTNDSFDKHIKDTITAGAGLCDPNVVNQIISEGPNIIAQLQQFGAHFNSTAGQLDLAKEGGHSHRRVVHFADKTGQHVSEVLIKQTLKRSNITIIENTIAIDLIDLSKATIIHAKVFVLASGGNSGAYKFNTNPGQLYGDGIAIAWRAGCRIANLEFHQFHPTCLKTNDQPLLLSEALRGEGALLKLANGKRFMHKYHPKAELASRDIVALAIDTEIKKLQLDCVYLDLRHLDSHFIKTRFPTLFAKCLQAGYDMTTELLPIIPAAHYCCGGVVSNIHGETDRSNLYAVGEVGCTFLHGANRLASNSLLECLVVASNAAAVITANISKITIDNSALQLPFKFKAKTLEDANTKQHIDALKTIMSDYLSVQRNQKSLLEGQQKVQQLAPQIQQLLDNSKPSSHWCHLRNLLTVVQLTFQCVLNRKESRGLNYNQDFPNSSSIAKNTILHP